MSATPSVIHKHKVTAKEHLAGLAAARRFHQELAAAHLLKSQQPISDQPVTDDQAPTP